MFSLLVAGNEAYWDLKATYAMSTDRFLEQTQGHLREKFFPRRKLRFTRTLASYPALIGYEPKNRTDGGFRLARLTDIRQHEDEIRFGITWTDTIVGAEIILGSPDFFETSGWGLETTHWGLKAGDLPAFLASHGIAFEPPDGTHAMSVISRTLAIVSARLLGALNHVDLDGILLDMDLPEVDFSREVGGTRDRAEALASAVASYPDVIVHGGERLDRFLLGRAMKVKSHELNENFEEIHERFRNQLSELFPLPNTPDPLKYVSSPAAPVQAGPVATIVQEPIVIERVSTIAMTAAASALPPPPKPRVFIVHGRDEPFKIEVENFLRKIGTEPVILHEQPNGGRHLLTKFMEEAATCQVAVVLMAAEDIGRHREEKTDEERARQNVVFELGFFLGTLPPKRTIMIVKGKPAMPSDMSGVVHVSHSGSWKADLARELDAAEIAIDARAALRS